MVIAQISGGTAETFYNLIFSCLLIEFFVLCSFLLWTWGQDEAVGRAQSAFTLCVCAVCVQLPHSEDQKKFIINRVRTFWLVLQTSKGCLKVKTIGSIWNSGPSHRDVMVCEVKFGKLVFFGPGRKHVYFCCKFGHRSMGMDLFWRQLHWPFEELQFLAQSYWFHSSVLELLY